MDEYLAKIKEKKEVKPMAEFYHVFQVTCPHCGWFCEVQTADENNVGDLVTRCKVCGKTFWKRDKSKFRLLKRR